MNKKLRLLSILVFFQAVQLVFNAADAQNAPPPLMFHASQSGHLTLDQGEGGGKPFASALIELLSH